MPDANISKNNFVFLIGFLFYICYLYFFIIIDALCPPKPSELDIA